ncbi:CPBP family intramembrane metalloprotease [Candidatus Micrarchaeota archaeon]|nr:CPBP family intramembrane metalloprotease [Candidatus Micrarchaeota archaeon]
MDFWWVYLNRWLIPVLLTATVLFFHFNQKEIRKRIGKLKNKNRREWVSVVFDGFSLRLDDWRFTVVLPIIAAFALDLLAAWVFQQPLRSMGEPLFTAVATSGFLNPVSEEFLVRGLLLGMFLATAIILKKPTKFTFLKKPVKISEASYQKIAWALVILTGLVFSFAHDNVIFFQFAGRLASGVLYGALYLASGRNLLPAIVAHAAGNWLIIALDAPHF